MGTLSDLDIRTEIQAGRLVENAEMARVGPSCYELRMGSVYYDLTEGDKRIDAADFGTIVIKPGHRVVLITLERVLIPNHLVGRVTSKGSLFSVGLSPVSTYADPGFSGNLGIVTQNLGDKYIELQIGEPIAKIDFSQLTSAAQKPYVGQHGYHTKIWPIRHQLQKSHHEMQHDKRVGDELAESFKILPQATVTALKALQEKQRRIHLAILLSLFLNSFLLGAVTLKYVDVAVSIITNILSTGLIVAFMWWQDKPKR
jgi:dCTP deaminase